MDQRLGLEYRKDQEGDKMDQRVDENMYQEVMENIIGRRRQTICNRT